ncbi:hypothetical protein ILUMI_02721 [Ignelater luminosus]|uniref:Uncharacterized protein n=1 Tax=Ignelater luminosus TaxID=2038154 RepID=A0A8K0DCW2_IGNLU|nr:hypothetical protein ILUMI_02721 [Ignelater luminosus]
MNQNGEMPENTCRLCDEGGPSMHSVFERIPEGQQVLQLIKDCLELLIYRTDPLPKQVCNSCYKNLIEFSNFKKTTLKTFERQKERLRENNSENNVSVRLYLNALEQENGQLDNLHNSYEPSNEDHNKPSDNNETELCAQLHKAIQDSLRKSKLQENYIEEQKLTNGHAESQDEDSQTSKELRGTDSPYSMSQNAESQSDMECDSDGEYTLKITTSNIRGKRLLRQNHNQGPALKRRRFVGPKSRVTQRRERFMKILHDEKVCDKKVIVKYNPLSLLKCVLNCINKQNVPDYECDSFEKVEVNEYTLVNGDGTEKLVLQEDNICECCERIFLDVNDLAVHESKHMFVVLGEKVDTPRMWTNKEVDSSTRNLWWNSINGFKKSPKVIRNFDDSTGHVNVFDPEDVSFKDENEEASNDHQELLVPRDANIKGEVILIDTQAYVNGVLLSDLSKDDRRSLYKTVTVNGLKRKFCPLCRYTFKDNWAIESHYFSTACHYTCRFCGVRFNKQRNEFDDHIKEHVMAGDKHTTKIFASRKFHTVPRIINEKKVNVRPPPVVRTPYTRKIKPLKMKRLFERKPIIPEIDIKKEPNTDFPSTPPQEGVRTDGKQNQAYFCRKCYQVFFKLDEFNVHVVSCNGTAFKNNRIVYNHTPKAQPMNRPKAPPEPEKFSPTGRPMRNCVKEIGTYADDVEDMEIQTHMKKMNIVKSSRGFECGMCSSCFPTVHSRNSHMRIHKAALHALNKKSINIHKTRPENVAKRMMNMVERNNSNIPSFTKYVNNVKIKQEPMEPIVEIHEQPSSQSNYIGAVSITPIPNSSQKTTLDPSIMRLVQNNPNLTIKTMGDRNLSSLNRNMNNSSGMGSGSSGGSMIPSPDGDAKCYRCLSCSKPFSNKSNLYFHKKNQCSGSKYPCPFCKKRFGTEAAYSSHIFYNHPE